MFNTTRWITTLAFCLLAVSAFAADITLEGNDQMQFNIKSFTVKPGETVNLTLKHVGKLPKAAMGHNVVILKMGTDAQTWGLSVPSKGGNAGNDYIPTDKSAIVAHTKMVGGGETVKITFKAPDKAGSYPFCCTFPGHVAMMRGVMEVK